MIDVRIIHILAALDLGPLPQPGGVQDGSTARTAFNLFLMISGAVALLIITVAGFRISISRGDPGTITKSKNTIIFAMIGLVVIAFSAVIVRFVFTRI